MDYQAALKVTDDSNDLEKKLQIHSPTSSGNPPFPYIR